MHALVMVDCWNSCIPACTAANNAGVLFTGRGKPVADEKGSPLLLCNGQPRVGRGLAESTFRKVYHALRTLHVHFQTQTEYKV